MSKSGESPPKKARKKSFPRLGRQRRQANQRERARAQRISDAIEELRSALWKDESPCRGKSVILTLRTAMDYIQLLHKTAEGEELSDEETRYPAFALLQRYREENMLTTKAKSTSLQSQCLELLEDERSRNQVDTSPNSVHSSPPPFSTLSSLKSSSGCSTSPPAHTCISSVFDELDLCLTDYNIEDLILGDIADLKEFPGSPSCPLDLVQWLDISVSYP